MPAWLAQSFTPLLQAFQSCFTQPSFCSFWDLVCAWILCSGRRSLTRVIQSAQLSPFESYCSFHRFFSQVRWNQVDVSAGLSFGQSLRPGHSDRRKRLSGFAFHRRSSFLFVRRNVACFGCAIVISVACH